MGECPRKGTTSFQSLGLGEGLEEGGLLVCPQDSSGCGSEHLKSLRLYYSESAQASRGLSLGPRSQREAVGPGPPKLLLNGGLPTWMCLLSGHVSPLEAA